MLFPRSSAALPSQQQSPVQRGPLHAGMWPHKALQLPVLTEAFCQTAFCHLQPHRTTQLNSLPRPKIKALFSTTPLPHPVGAVKSSEVLEGKTSPVPLPGQNGNKHPGQGPGFPLQADSAETSMLRSPCGCSTSGSPGTIRTTQRVTSRQDGSLGSRGIPWHQPCLPPTNIRAGGWPRKETLCLISLHSPHLGVR